GNRVIDDHVLGWMTARDREVALVGGGPGLGERARGLAIEREQRHARGAAIEAMDRIDARAHRVAHDLEQGFVVVGPAAMRGDAAGLIHGDAARVAMEDRDHSPRCSRKKSIWTCSFARFSFGSGTMCVADSVITSARLCATYSASISASVCAK